MPAALTGLSNFAGAPSTTKPNASPNTPFDPGGSATAGVGTGSLGEFGGYIPTPLNQFNNYQDYLNYMPGAQQMDYFASDPLNYGGIGMSDRWGFTQDILRNPMQEWQGAIDANNYIQDVSKRFWDPAAEQMFTQSQNLYNLEDPIKQQAFDPQQALYNRTLQQLTDQSRAGLEARGIDMTPYGAGVEGSTLSNFNIDWQNSQLQRMLQGAQGIGGLAEGGAGLAAAGQNMQEQSAEQRDYWAKQPMMEYNSILQNQIDAVNQYQDYGLKAMIPGQMTFKNWQDVQNQFLTANQQSFNQNQISGFEDPFAEMQLQSQIEMQREQMNLQEQMQEKQMKQQQQQAMMGMGMQGLGMLGGMGGKGCWIAEAIYGVDDERTHLVRAWLNGPFRRTLLGSAVMAVYIAIGQRVAAVVRAYPLVKSMFKPLFDCALRKARSEIVMNPNRRV